MKKYVHFGVWTRDWNLNDFLGSISVRFLEKLTISCSVSVLVLKKITNILFSVLIKIKISVPVSKCLSTSNYKNSQNLKIMILLESSTGRVLQCNRME